uniref:Uncharacterized protein n=1 Tax=Rhizophora mucronata TaxID=61149 RepID=A0A2P2LUH5_RHIMU
MSVGQFGCFFFLEVGALFYSLIPFVSVLLAALRLFSEVAECAHCFSPTAFYGVPF